MLCLFVALAMLTLACIGWSSLVGERIWSGAIGPPVDSMQYLSWIRESAFHGLIGNRFQLGPVDRVFLHPAIVVSAALHRLGISIPIAYALWVPVGLVVLCLGVTAYLRRLVAGAWPRAAALALALLATAPMLLDLARWIAPEGRSARFIVFDSWPINWLWGYPLTAISVGLACLVLLGVERGRKSARITPLLPLGALLCAWLQPWQGAILIAVVFSGELLAKVQATNDQQEASAGRWRMLAPTLIAGALPMAYYAILGIADPSWHEHGIQDNLYESTIPWWSVPLVLSPLLLPALVTLWRRQPSYQLRAAQLWVAFAVALFAFIQITGVGTFASHSMQGISVPLAALAVLGVQDLAQRFGRRPVLAIAVIGLAVMVVPGVVTSTERQVAKIRAVNSGYFVKQGEDRALAALAADPRPGGVLAKVRLGSQVPWRTGRSSWLGHESWTPQFIHRSFVAGMIFSSSEPQADGRSMAAARATGASFMLADCERTPAAAVETSGAALSRFGCASITELDRAGKR